MRMVTGANKFFGDSFRDDRRLSFFDTEYGYDTFDEKNESIIY